MRLRTLLLGVTLTAMSANAEYLNTAQAWQRASENSPAKVVSSSRDTIPQCVMQLKATTDTQAALYVFATSDESYVVVSADDCAAPVLGYSATGGFDSENLPSNIRWWLDSYADEISYARKHGATPYTASAQEFEPISPLVSTKWNQGAPYNNLCPTVSGTLTVTGCVATAMAQVMKYYNWPATGKGSNSYTWNSSTLSMNFANTSFDWTQMTDTYSSSSTDAENNAVANLMKACGYSVNMNYGTNASGAMSSIVAQALVKYFDYDVALHNDYRDNHSANEWISLIYNNLKEIGPVFYSGSNSSSGHAFVCDGYSESGYFHFNWGWGGMSDGYFKLSALNPGSQGIGGSTSGYNSYQEAILGVRPPHGGVTAAPEIVIQGNPSVSLDNNVLYFFGPIFNFSNYALNGYFSFDIVNQSTGQAFALSGQSQTYEPGTGISNSGFYISSLSAGTYRIYPTFVTSDGNTYDVKFPAYLEPYAVLTISPSGNTAVIPSRGDITATAVDFLSPFYLNNKFIVKASFQNSGDVDFSRTIVGLLLRSQDVTDIAAIGNELTADFASDAPTEIEYAGEWISRPSSAPALTTGNYYFCFAVNNGYSVTNNTATSSYKAVSQFYPVTMKQTSGTTKLSATLSIGGNPNNVSADDIKFNITASCSQGFFVGPLTVAIFPESGGMALEQFSTDYIALEAGQSKDLTLSVDFADAVAGSSYLALVYNGSTQLSSVVKFRIGTTTAMEQLSDSDWAFTVTSSELSIQAPEAIKSVKVCNVSGSEILTASTDGSAITSVSLDKLSAGVYVAVVTTGSEVKSHKFIVK